MRLKHRAIARAARKIGDQSDRAAFSATWVRLHAQEIADRANSDMDDAIASTSYGSRSSDPATPTEAKALRYGDQVTRMALALADALVEADRLTRKAELVMQNAERAGRWLLAMDAEEARKLAGTEEVKSNPEDETRSTVCANPNCQRVVARTPNDRLRGGRCDACRKYLDRNNVERPAFLCALGDAALSTEGLGLDTERLIVEREEANRRVQPAVDRLRKTVDRLIGEDVA